MLLRFFSLFLLFFLLTFGGYAFSEERINVLVSAQWVADIVRKIGGDYVSVSAVVGGKENSHAVEPRPSFFTWARKADLFVLVGLGYEDAFLGPLLENSGNPKIQEGRVGYLDLGFYVEVIGRKQRSRVFGEIHPFGNPHYWLYPKNVITSAERIYQKLSEFLPEKRDYFYENYKSFTDRFEKTVDEVRQILQDLQGVKIVPYHNETAIDYFAKYFNLEVVGYIEEKPGIPPSSSYLLELSKKIKGNCDAILVEVYYSSKPAESLSKNTGCPWSWYPHDVNAFDDVKDIFSLYLKNAEIIKNTVMKKSSL